MCKKNKPLTDLKKLRLSYNISTADLCAELQIATSVYLVNESGRRPYKSKERYEQFYYDCANALERIHRRRLKEVEEATQAELVKNSGKRWTNEEDLKILAMQMVEDDEDDEDLLFVPLTETVFKQALEMIMKGLSVVQVAVRLGVCELELGKRIGTMES